MTALVPRLWVSAQKPYVTEGWVVLAVLWAYPVWWALGVASYTWILAAIPAAFWLWGQAKVALPKGFGLWLIFLGWMLLSGTQVEAGPTILVFGYRAALYVASGILLVYVYNLSAETRRRILTALAVFWAMSIGFGLVTLIVPNFSYVSPFEQILPGGLASTDLIRQLSRPALAQVQDFIGYEVSRPAAPFGYTNNWGSAVALLAPVAFVWAASRRGTKRVLGIVVGLLALIPIVQSLNRGLWLSLGAGFIYVAFRGALQGRVRTLAFLVVAGAVIGALVLGTSLTDLASSRVENGHSDDRRLNLYEQSIDGIAASPIVGYGGPIADPEKPDRAPIGTHGQIWMVTFSHGIPAAVFFVAFLIGVMVATRRGAPGSIAFAANVTFLIALVQLPIYTYFPAQISLLCIVAALGLAEVRNADGLVDATAH